MFLLYHVKIERHILHIVIIDGSMKYLIIAITVLALTGCGQSSEVNSSPSTDTAGQTTNSVNQTFDSNLENAKTALSNGNYKQAITEADQSLAKNPNNAGAYSIRGFAIALNGDIEKGLADTKKSYELDPNDVANYYNMAMVYKLGGQLNESKQWFEKVLNKDPNNTWSIYGIATIYADQGDDAKALEWLAAAIKIDSSVKAVAAEQDHFERFHGNPTFESLVH